MLIPTKNVVHENEKTKPQNTRLPVKEPQRVDLGYDKMVTFLPGFFGCFKPIFHGLV